MIRSVMTAMKFSFGRRRGVVSRSEERGKRIQLHPELMTLEKREVMSALPSLVPPSAPVAVKSTANEVSVVTPSLSNRILVVRGTKNNDVIDVTLSGSNLKVAGKSYASSSVDKIVVVGEQGNDKITVSTSITKWTRLFGGTGNDTIYGGNGVDNIYGGAGNDKLYGRGGNDVLYGGSGQDTLDVGSGSNQTKNAGSPNRTYAMNSTELEVVRIVNVERSKAGLRPVKANSQLAEAAKLHADNMAGRSNSIGNDAAHNHVLLSVTLPTPSSRIDYVGYDNFRRRSENIAYGYSSAKDVMKGWMNSSGHRANILTADVTEIGVAFSTNSRGTRFWCQVFGVRA